MSALDRLKNSSILPEPGRRLSRKRRASAPTWRMSSRLGTSLGFVATAWLLCCSSPAHELLSTPGRGGAGGASMGGTGPLGGGAGGPTGGAAGSTGGVSGTGGEPALRCRDDQDCPPPAVCIAGSCALCDQAETCLADCPPGFRTVRIDCARCGCASLAACQDDQDCIDPRRPEDVCHEAPDGSRLCGHRNCPNLTIALAGADPGCPLSCLGCRCGPEGVWECGTQCVNDCVP